MTRSAESGSTGHRHILAVDLGLTSYKPTWDLQQRLFDLRRADRIGDVLLLTEHHHVYTVGKSGTADHLLAGEEELRDRGAEVFLNDRGGDVTYHGPGQLVVYPILGLWNYTPDIHRYLRDLEEVVIRVLADLGIAGRRDPSYTGVWVGNDKIAALGVRVRQWTTMHGLALNNTTDLTFFDRIIPCGIFHRGVTSIERVLGTTVAREQLVSSLLSHLAEVFGAEIMQIPEQEFIRKIPSLHPEQTECLQ